MVPHHPAPSNQALLHSFTAKNGASAVASPQVADALQDLLQHDVTEWPQLGMERVKLRTVRRVFRGQLGTVSVHIKVFRADTIAARARDSLCTGKGEREATHLNQVRQLGLPTVEALAHGWASEGGHAHSFLVTRTIESTDFSWPSDPRVAQAVGTLLRRVHDAGLEPGDLHPANVLITALGEPLLCDLTSLRHVGDLSMRKRAAALAFFCNPIDGGALDKRTRAFRRGYEAGGNTMPAGFADELARATRQLRATALRSFGRRSTRSCKHTEAEPRRRATARWFWHLHDADTDRDLRAACMAFDGSDLEPLRTGRRGSVWLTETLAVKDREAGKARKLWLASYWLLFAKVPIATPVALRIHQGRGHVFVRRLRTDDLRTELANDRLNQEAIAQAARALGNFVGRLHGHGLRNRDLKFDNLVRDPASNTIAMVDLDGVSLHSAQETRGCGRDLGRLLAAFRHAGCPGGDVSLRRFVHAYVRARRRLLQSPPMPRILKRAEQRAGEWAKNH